MSTINKTYRVTLFDRNCIRPNIEEFVSAPTKTMAIDAARIMLHAKAQKQIELLTSGMAVCTTTMLNSKGEQVVCTMREVSPEYYNTLVDECWGVAECKPVDPTFRSVSSESAVAKAEQKLQANFAACENDELGDSSVQRRKRRWTKAQKRLAKERRDAAKAARAEVA